MFKTKKWTFISLFGGIALVLAIAGVWLFSSASVASAAEMTADDLKTFTRSTTGPGLLGEGYLAHGGGGRWGFKGGTIDYFQFHYRKQLRYVYHHYLRNKSSRVADVLRKLRSQLDK